MGAKLMIGLNPRKTETGTIKSGWLATIKRKSAARLSLVSKINGPVKIKEAVPKIATMV